MPLFKYKALSKEGKSYEETVEVSDKSTLFKRIKESGGSIIYTEEVKSRTSTLSGKLGSFFGRVSTQEKIVFARNLAAMLEAGLSVTRVLSVMEKQTKSKTLKSVFRDLGESISQGKSLSDSLKDKSNIFSPLFISMVRSGEESGSLSKSLRMVSLQMEKSYLLTKKIKGAMMYPAVVLSIMVVIGVLMLVYMVPSLTETFKGLGIDLPLSTRVVIAMSDFLRESYFLVLGAIAALIAALILVRRSVTGKKFIDLFFIKAPIVGGIVKEINAARTARTLSSLLSSGVDIFVALGVTKEVIQNSFFREVLNRAEKSVEKGDPISSVFIANDNLYPVFLGEMVSVGEETGKMSEMLLSVAIFYEDEVDQKTKDMSTLIEPFLMILMGVVVGFFALSMLAPTYSLVDAL